MKPNLIPLPNVSAASPSPQPAPTSLFDQTLSRRSFLSGTAGMMAATVAPTNLVTKRSGPEIVAAIDAHTHFYDPTRPQGVPWPPRTEPRLYRRVLPADYKALPQPHPVGGTVVVEASPWLDDNEWILNLADREQFIVGFVGNLDPTGADFAKQVKRFSDHWLFRGIRVRDEFVSRAPHEPRLKAALKVLADLDRVLEVNVPPGLLPNVAALAAEVPKLRIVLDHLANVHIDGRAPDPDWVLLMRTAARHKRVFCKVSGLVEGSGRNNGTAPRELYFYRPILNAVWEIFGEDRLIYGSNWPVSSLFADLATVQRLPYEYFSEKGLRALSKVMASNAQAAYKCPKR